MEIEVPKLVYWLATSSIVHAVVGVVAFLAGTFVWVEIFHRNKRIRTKKSLPEWVQGLYELLLMDCNSNEHCIVGDYLKACKDRGINNPNLLVPQVAILLDLCDPKIRHCVVNYLLEVTNFDANPDDECFESLIGWPIRKRMVSIWREAEGVCCGI